MAPPPITATSTSQIQVRFFTKHTQYVLPQVAVMVPTHLKRYGLSEVINHLLGTSDTPIPFDFLIEKALLRVSLQEYLDEHQLSTENILQVEVIESILPPKTLASFPHDEWISSVAISRNACFLTGGYDHIARIWNASAECTHTLRGHSAPVKAVRWLSPGSQQPSETSSSMTCLTGSQDQTIRIWKCSVGGDEAQTVMELRGHEKSVDALDYHDGVILSGSWDAAIKVWHVDPAEELDGDTEELASSSKRQQHGKRRKTDTAVKQKTCTSTMNAHAGPVSAVVIDRKSPSNFYSGSWDHTVRVWNLEAGCHTNSLSCDHVVTSLDHSSLNGLLASGHSDRLIRLWDPRSTDGAMVKMRLASHTNWVSSVAWSPESSYMLLSGSYDGTMKVWDIRSTQPLYTMASQEDSSKVAKLLDCAWGENGLLAGGGEDGKLRVHSYTARTEEPEVVGQ